MVVEDDPLDFGFLKTAFESVSAPAELFCWPTIEGAIDEMLDKACDMAVVDINLRDGSGIDLVSAIRDHDRVSNLPVVTLSSSINHADIVRCYSAGANAYLEKPLSMERYRAFAQAFTQFWLRAAILPD